MKQAFLEGLLLQASVILALGAQNIFVIQYGLKKQHRFLIATLCSLCDALLIFGSIIGMGVLFLKFPLFKIGFGAVGVLFLLYYGSGKIFSKVSHQDIKVNEPKMPVTQVIMVCLAFSLLNPHVYLDAIVIIGGCAAKFASFEQRLYFGLGASVFSTLWFFSLIGFASLLSQFFENANRLAWLYKISGLILWVIALGLAQDVWRWWVQWSVLA